jgi:tetratricopeptide (TPR) repeat protein
VDVRSRETLAQAKSDGPVTDVFALQDAIVTQLSSGLALTVTPAAALRINARETSSLEAYRALTLGRLKLEALDLAEVPGAIADFERALQLDPDYALAHVGLAHARFWKFQASRARLRPDRDELTAAVVHARRAVEIDPELAEGHAALAFFLSSADRGREAVAAGRIASALEPGNWRHQFRLGVAAWGDERIQSLQAVIAQFPALAYAYLALAMPYVARNDLATARTILARGITFESAQAAQGRFPGRGLHWLLGLVDLASGDVPAAQREFDAELSSRAAAVYDDEFTMDACAGLGYAHLAEGDASAAAASFERGLERVPDHARLVVGLSESAARLKQRDRAKELLARAGRSVDTLVSEGRTVEASMSRACWLVASGRPDEAIAELGTLLDSAPAGSAGWTIPIEPGLAALRGSPRFKRLLARLADRAR